MTHIPVSVGSDRSRSVRPSTFEPSRTLTRAVISSAWRRSRRSASGIPSLRLDHAADVARGVADLLDRVGDPQDAGHALGVVGVARGEHRDHAEPAQVVVHPLLEPLDLARELLLVEEDGRVREVDHELRGVLRLDQEVLDGPGLVIHAVAPPMMS